MTNKNASGASLSLYLKAFIVFLVSYQASVWILELYVNGDQIFYHALYNQLSWVKFKYIFEAQYNNTGSREPLYGVMLWIASHLIDKNTFVSLCNSILTSSLFIFLARNRASYLFMALAATNFYVLVLMAAAERLKFAFMFAILALVLPRAWRGAMIVASLLCHLSVLIIFLALLIPQRLREAVASLGRGGLRAWESMLALVATFAAFIVFFYFFQDPIMQKVIHYASYDYMDMGAAVLLFVVALFVTNDRPNMAMTMAFPLIATFVLSGQRVNMLTTTIFLYVVIKEGKTNHPAVLLIMGYLSFKSIDFIQNILEYGTGFAS